MIAGGSAGVLGLALFGYKQGWFTSADKKDEVKKDEVKDEKKAEVKDEVKKVEEKK